MGPEPPFQKSSKPVVTTAGTGFLGTSAYPGLLGPTSLWSPCVALSCRERECLNPPPHRSEQTSSQMALRQLAGISFSMSQTAMIAQGFRVGKLQTPSYKRLKKNRPAVWLMRLLAGQTD